MVAAGSERSLTRRRSASVRFELLGQKRSSEGTPGEVGVVRERTDRLLDVGAPARAARELVEPGLKRPATLDTIEVGGQRRDGAPVEIETSPGVTAGGEKEESAPRARRGARPRESRCSHRLRRRARRRRSRARRLRPRPGESPISRASRRPCQPVWAARGRRSRMPRPRKCPSRPARWRSRLVSTRSGSRVRSESSVSSW